MARLFDDAQNEYSEIDQAVLSGRPLAMVCWFNTDDDTSTQSLMIITDKSAAFDYLRLYIHGNNDITAYDRSATASDGAKELTGFAVNTWHHACGIFVSATDRRVILNGTLKATNATNVGAINNLDRTSLGRYSVIGSETNYLSGMIAEAAIYDLSAYPGDTAADKADYFEKAIASMAKGFIPLFYPLGLKAYWPLIRGLNDRVGGYNLTASGTTVSAHPRIIQPCGTL